MRGPEKCPTCHYDPTGDSEEFRSGGGWEFDNSVADGIYAEILLCPRCGEEVNREHKRMGGGRGVRGP